MFAEFKYSSKNLWELIVDLFSVAFVIYIMVIDIPKLNLSNSSIFLVTFLSVVTLYFCNGVIRPFIDKRISNSRKEK